MIDDGVDPFAGGALDQVTGDAGGRRRVGVGTIAVLVAMIGYGVATSATSRDAAKPVPAASTTTAPAVVSSAARRTTSAAAASMPFFAASPPPAFSVHYANLQDVDHAPSRGYTYALWATKGAAAGTGAWFAVTTYRGASTLSAANARRVRTDRSTIAIAHVRGGQSVTQFVDGGVGVSITSFGWSDADLLRLAGSVTSDGQTVLFSDTWFGSDHNVLTTVQPLLAVQGVVAEQVSYVSTDAPGTNIAITVARRPNGSKGGSRFNRETALRFLLQGSSTFDVGGLPAVAGTIVGRETSMATWIDGDNVITVSSPMAVPELIDIARTVHRVSPTEWESMKLTALRINAPRAAVIRSQLPSIADGTDARSLPWTIGVTMSYSGSRQVNWWWEGSGFGSPATAAAEINTVVDEDRTYVLADLPRSVTTSAAHLEISRAGFDPVDVSFSDAGPQMDRTFAAYVFSEATPYTAQIVGDDGSVLATWPSA